MYIVVADTSPIRYLAEIDHLQVLPRLFERIYIPPVVYEELQRPATPPSVRGQLNPAPAWLMIASPDTADDDYALKTLDEGERAALLLGLQLKAELILIDERKGAAVAKQKGFRITGTIGILVLAAQRDLVSLEDAFARLRETTFHCPGELMKMLLAQQKRKSQ